MAKNGPLLEVQEEVEEKKTPPAAEKCARRPGQRRDEASREGSVD